MKHAANRRRGVSTRAFVALLALVLVIGCVAGGTVAWLVAKTDPVVNTFTYGDINIELAETKPVNQQAKIIPGVDIEKDPKVTVKANSEACWLFVKIEESSNLDSFISYNVAAGWTELNTGSGIYYREVAASATDTPFYVLENNQVTVNDTVTKDMMDGLKVTDATQPTLTFTAYACQKDNVASATEAWGKINPST